MDKEQTTNNNGQQSFFYKLLMDPGKGFRISRHALFILGVAAISFNQVYMGFFEYSDLLCGKLYICMLFLVVTYLLEGYINMYVLIPRFFLKGRYVTYFILFFLFILFFVISHYSLEYFVFRLYNLEPGIYSYFKTHGSPFWLEFIAAYFIDSIVIMGVGMIILLKHWLINDKRMHQLERRHIRNEVDTLKEQMTPQFLFATLHRIGDIAVENQQVASDMLMELSGILRYQLYDSNRETVLLNAEIQFISTYLTVEKLYYKKMDFDIRSEKEMNRILVPPFLFFPFVQYAVKDFQKGEDEFFLEVSFKSDTDSISFFCGCKSKGLLDAKDFDRIKQRLEGLFQGRYSLQAENQPGKLLPSIHLKINL